MRKLTESEMLSISKMLQMETNGLALSKATLGLIEDQELRSFAESGIQSAEARIKGLQQFINENNIISTQEVH